MKDYYYYYNHFVLTRKLTLSQTFTTTSVMSNLILAVHITLLPQRPVPVPSRFNKRNDNHNNHEKKLYFSYVYAKVTSAK